MVPDVVQRAVMVEDCHLAVRDDKILLTPTPGHVHHEEGDPSRLTGSIKQLVASFDQLALVRTREIYSLESGWWKVHTGLMHCRLRNCSKLARDVWLSKIEFIRFL
ncbi:hypothetical protein ElyMa_004063700 [Elysia marginata]|uniref:Uncharacterized protein n=1 Tax=Elysia marginata TaxID=1093978 RepID=A0AAV4G7G7_9GAST|nr:hypothetical protein ElyMa_004063700 [Elysia marginata]